MKAYVLESHCIVNEDGRASNLKSSLARGFPIVQDVPEREGALAIIGSGPSVADNLERLRDWPGHLWAINGAYDYLLHNDIVPEGFIGLDPLPGLTEYVQNAQAYTTFYLASTCDPAVFDALDGHNIHMWHACGEDSSVFPPGDKVVYGGTTAACRAPFLAMALGWRDITLFGMDSSYSQSGPYCYQWGTYKEDVDQPVLKVVINGEGPFYTEVGMLKQVAQLGVMLTMFNQKRDILKVDPAGLVGAFMRAPFMDQRQIEVVPNGNADAA